MSGLVSIIIPARNEPFLVPTVQDVLSKATGPVEVIVVLEGYWPHSLSESMFGESKYITPAEHQSLPDDKRVVTLHHGAARGMRPSINEAVAIAQGDYLLKLDGHCMVERGFDEVLKSECEPDWLVIPRRLSLDPIKWGIKDNGKGPVDYHYLSWPFEAGRPGAGLHGTVWKERARERQHLLLDEEMSSQGSCWFCDRRHWSTMGPMDAGRYGNFVQEMQEIGLKTWLSGGKMMVNKKTSYAHLHKGKEFGRGYFISKQEMSAGSRAAVEYWMKDQWPERKHDLKHLIDRFWPVPGWPVDWQQQAATATWIG